MTSTSKEKKDTCCGCGPECCGGSECKCGDNCQCGPECTCGCRKNKKKA